MRTMSTQNKRIARKYLSGKLTAQEAMEQAGVTRATVSTWKKNADNIKIKRPRVKGKTEATDTVNVTTKATTSKAAIKKIMAICLEELGV